MKRNKKYKLLEIEKKYLLDETKEDIAEEETDEKEESILLDEKKIVKVQNAPLNKKLILTIITIIIIICTIITYYNHKISIIQNSVSGYEESQISNQVNLDKYNEIKDNFINVLGYTEEEFEEMIKNLDHSTDLIYLQQLNDLYMSKEQELNSKLLDLENKAKELNLNITKDENKTLIENINIFQTAIDEENERLEEEQNNSNSNLNVDESSQEGDSNNNTSNNTNSSKDEEPTDVCYPDYETAYNIALDTFLNDSQIEQKGIVGFEVSSSDNCIHWYDISGNEVSL